MRQVTETTELSRIETLIADEDQSKLSSIFASEELDEPCDGAGRIRALAAGLAAKQACMKLFSKELRLGKIELRDFALRQDTNGTANIVPNATARAVMDRHRVGEVAVSLSHTDDSVTATVEGINNPIVAPWFGKLLYQVFPWRKRVVLANMELVFGETLSKEDIVTLAQAFYGHLWLCLVEYLKMPFLSARRKAELIRIEGGEHLVAARDQGKGVLILTGHFGNWEVATVAGIAQFKEYQGLFHFIRRPLKPKWFNDFVMLRFRKAGFGTLDKAGSLDEILDLLENNEIVVSIFDQATNWNWGIASEFFGHRVFTFKSVAVLAQGTGAPVVPSSSWREPDGTHVLRFDAPLQLCEGGRARDLTLKNTQLCNEAIERIILRHPEQWIWMHRRWRWRAAWDQFVR